MNKRVLDCEAIAAGEHLSSKDVAELIDLLRFNKITPRNASASEWDSTIKLCGQAADEIERLTAELADRDETVAQLQGFADAHKDCVGKDEIEALTPALIHRNELWAERDRLRAALERINRIRIEPPIGAGYVGAVLDIVQAALSEQPHETSAVQDKE